MTSPSVSAVVDAIDELEEITKKFESRMAKYRWAMKKEDKADEERSRKALGVVLAWRDLQREAGEKA